MLLFIIFSNLFGRIINNNIISYYLIYKKIIMFSRRDTHYENFYVTNAIRGYFKKFKPKNNYFYKRRTIYMGHVKEKIVDHTYMGRRE